MVGGHGIYLSYISLLDNYSCVQFHACKHSKLSIRGRGGEWVPDSTPLDPSLYSYALDSCSGRSVASDVITILDTGLIYQILDGICITQLDKMFLLERDSYVKICWEAMAVVVCGCMHVV